MHNEHSKECIIHKSIVNHELTDLSGGFGNKVYLYPIDLVWIKWKPSMQSSSSFVVRYNTWLSTIVMSVKLLDAL